MVQYEHGTEWMARDVGDNAGKMGRWLKTHKVVHHLIKFMFYPKCCR